MNKHILLLVLVGILSIGLVNAFGVWSDLSPYSPSWDSPSWVGNSTAWGIAVTDNGLIYTGHYDGKFGVLNETTNTWTDLSATDTGNWMGPVPQRTLYADGDNVFIGGSIFGIYNYSSNISTIISSPPSAGSIYAIVKYGELFFMAGPGNQVFFMWNSSNGITSPPVTNITDLTTTDPGDWATSTGIYDLVLSGDKLYTIMAGGKFGVYNISDGIWYDLSATDTWTYNAFISPNWLGTSQLNTGVLGSDGMIYVGGLNSQFGFYNPNTNILYKYNSHPALGSMYSMTIINDTIYAGGTASGGGITGFAAFNISNKDATTSYGGWWTSPSGSIAPFGETTNVQEGNWNTIANFRAPNNNNRLTLFGMTNKNGKVYTAMGTGQSTSLNVPKVAVYDNDRCESWSMDAYECVGGVRTITYTDMNNCNTTQYLPTNNGTTQNCSSTVNLNSCTLFTTGYKNTVLNISALSNPTAFIDTHCMKFVNDLTNVTITCENRTANANPTGTLTKTFISFGSMPQMYGKLYDVTIKDCVAKEWMQSIDLELSKINGTVTIDNFITNTSLTGSGQQYQILYTQVDAPSGQLTIKNSGCYKSGGTLPTTSGCIYVVSGTPNILWPLNIVIDNYVVQNLPARGIQIAGTANTTINNIQINNVSGNALILNGYQTYPNKYIIANSTINTPQPNTTNSQSQVSVSGSVCAQNVQNNLAITNSSKIYAGTAVTLYYANPTTATILFRDLPGAVLRECSFNNTGWWSTVERRLAYETTLTTAYGYYNTTNGLNYDGTSNASLLLFPNNQVVSNGCHPDWVQSKTDCSLGYQLTTYTDNNNCNSTDYLPSNNGTYNYCEINTTNFDRCGVINTPGTYTLTADINQTLNTKNYEYMGVSEPVFYCILINTSDIILDLNNRTITGYQGNTSYDSAYTYIAKSYNLTNITIANGNIYGDPRFGLQASNGDFGVTQWANFVITAQSLNATNLLLENMTFSGHFRRTVSTLGMSSDTTIRNILFKDIDAAYAQLIILQGSSTILFDNLLVENIEIRNAVLGTAGIISLGALNNSIIRNVIDNNVTTTGNFQRYTFYNLRNTLFENNTFRANGHAGTPSAPFTIQAGTSGLQYSTIKFVNNSIMADWTNFTGGYTLNPILMYQNVFIDNTSSGNIGWLLPPSVTNNIAPASQAAPQNNRSWYAYYNGSNGGYTGSGTYMSNYNTYYNNQGYNPCGVGNNICTCQDLTVSGTYVVAAPITFSTQGLSYTNITKTHAAVTPTLVNVSDADPLTSSTPAVGEYYINFTVNSADSSIIYLSRHRVPTQMTSTMYAWNYTSSSWDIITGDNTLGNNIYFNEYGITIANGFAYTLTPEYYSGGIVQILHNITGGSAPRWQDAQIYSETLGNNARTSCFNITTSNIILDFGSQTITQDAPYNNGNYNLLTITDGLTNTSLRNLEYHSAATGNQINFLGGISNNSFFTNLNFYGDNTPFDASINPTALINAVYGQLSSNIIFDDLVFRDINDTSTSGGGIYLLFVNNIENLTANNIIIDNVRGGNEMLWFGDLSSTTRYATGVRITNILFRNMSATPLVEGILVGGTENATLENINIDTYTQSGMLISLSKNIFLHNITNQFNVLPPQSPSPTYDGFRMGANVTINPLSRLNKGWFPCNERLNSSGVFAICYYDGITGQYNGSNVLIDANRYYATDPRTGNNFTLVLNTTALGLAINETQVSTDATGKIVWAVGQTDKIYVSTDYGQTWTNVSNPLINSGRSLYTHPDNSYWLIGSGSITYTGIYRSTDNGTSWTQVETTGTYNSIDCNNYGVCLAGRGSNPAPGGVLRSTDYGQTWTAILNITGISTSTMFVSDTNESIFGQLSSATPNSTIYYSNDTINYQKTVLPCSNVLPPLGTSCADSWRGLACNNNDINECYITLSTTTTLGVPITGIYQSTSKGYNWTLIQPTPNITDYRYGTGSLDLSTYASSHANGTLVTHYMETPFTVNEGIPMRGSAVSGDGHYAYAASTIGNVYRSTDIYYASCSVCNETCSPCGGGCTATNISYMYDGVTNFDATYGNISGWDTSCITHMQNTFSNSDFNQDISGWNTSAVIDMRYTFAWSPFNQPIGGWDVSKVVLMDGTFRGTNFSQDISGWNTTALTSTINMFRDNTVYNQPMNNWNMSKVTNTAGMFSGATSFNQPLNSWITEKITSMGSMFTNSAFNQDLSSWNVENVTNMNNMFTSLSTLNYDAILNSWSAQAVKSNVPLGVGTTQYTIAASSARNVLTTTYNWNITDGGIVLVAMPPNVTKFDGATSNFTNLTLEQLLNFSGLILENTTNGKIEWNNIVNVNGANFDIYLNILHNFIIVDSANLHTSLNSPANISIYNIYPTNPAILKNGLVCNDCSIISNSGGTIKFSSTGFSNYTIVSTEYRNYTTSGYVTYANFTFDYYQEPNTTTTTIQCYDNTNNWIDIGTVTGN